MRLHFRTMLQCSPVGVQALLSAVRCRMLEQRSYTWLQGRALIASCGSRSKIWAALICTLVAPAQCCQATDLNADWHDEAADGRGIAGDRRLR
jgi:hypothetical protein